MTELTPTQSGIAADHSEIISGLEAVFGTLVDLNYVQNTDVQVPPHGLPKDPIAVVQLRAAGLAPETIELIGRLPCFTNEVISEQQKVSVHLEGIPITPKSSATSYLLGPGRFDESRDVGPGDVAKLPSTSFKLATATNAQGFYLAYDMEEKTVLQWRAGQFDARERITVAEFFDQWVNRLRTLEWLPWRNHRGWQMEQRREYNEKELADPDSCIAMEIQAKLQRQRKEWDAAGLAPEPIENLYAGYLVSYKMAHNRYWAKRHIYEEFGWPQELDKEAFSKRQDEFNAKARKLGATEGAGEEETEACKELLDFYRSAAGKNAV